MPRCTHKGCGKDFDEAHNAADSCTYHSGGPVFHEGLKSWSCCSDVNKPVLEFDEFMKIPGCTQGPHSAEPAKVEAPPAQVAETKPTSSEGQKEVYQSPAANSPNVATPAPATAEPQPPVEEEEDDLDVAVEPGTKCRRNGCKVTFESNEVNRSEGGERSVCSYHPLPPIFREGSKGYLCCKRRVLEFDEFLKIDGCKLSRHVFVPKKKDTPVAEQQTECRIDHYQTPSEVHVSIFAKQADKERSTVNIEPNQVHVDLVLPGPKRFRKSLELFGPVNPEASSFKFFGTKVELLLKKADSRSWTILQKPTKDLGNVSLTFGVGGRTGTIGAKELVLDESNKIKA